MLSLCQFFDKGGRFLCETWPQYEDVKSERSIVMATEKKEKHVVTGDQYREIDRKMREIKRQLDSKAGSPLDPARVDAELEDLGRHISAVLQRVVEGSFGDEYPATIDYDLSLREMIEAGKYDWKDGNITVDHFPVEGEGEVEANLILVRFGRTMSSDQVLEDLDKRDLRPLRPATLAELLAFGAKYLEVQRECSIVALGSVWAGSGGRRSVPCLCEGASLRHLYLSWLGDDWSDCSCFLAVRK